MNRVFLLLGSNINKEHNLPAALDLLRAMTTVVSVAPIYESTPVLRESQPIFWNSAVIIETPLSPTDVKQRLIGRIEQRLKRVRSADKNAPRTIDIDIAFFNDAVGSYDGGDGRDRPLPDPDTLRFAHAAVPLADLAPDMAHPTTGDPLSAIAARLSAETDTQTLRQLSPQPILSNQ